MRKRENEAGSSILVSECEAYLSGTLAEYWDEKGVLVPVWAWTNLLAHGSEGLIGDSVLRPNRCRRAGRRWRIARSFLAYQVLELTGVELALTDLQASVLIPLELEMANRSEVSRWTPRQWVDTVDRAIRNQDSSREP
jgi:hypothetical protein